VRYTRMSIEIESPEELGYDRIQYNLSESSITDQRLSDLDIRIPDLALFYNEHRGSPGLRALVTEEASNLSAGDVLITHGAAGALFIVATSLLTPADHLIVVRPNYATNLETPRAICCEITFIDLTFEDGFALDVDAVRRAVQPNTKLISVTCPHNPTGVILSEAQMRALTSIARDLGIKLLVDETYRDLSMDGMLPIAASLGKEVISVSSLSKAFGVPGIRLGWIITSDAGLQELFLAAKEQISICGSVINEWIAEQILLKRAAILSQRLDAIRHRRQLVEDWISQEPRLEWVRPSGGVVCFPRMRERAVDPQMFYQRLANFGTYVGPGHWFEMPDRYFRLGFGWPSLQELERGLEGISKALPG
jgi:aspartate/methionine/tyrosine aminotransferase